MTDLKNRRPLNSRDTGWAKRITQKLAAANVTPNQISAASLVFAALAGGCFAAVGWTEGGARVVLLIAGALNVQARLLCNLFDGMVAVEAGQAAPTGPFWNEVPDRPADIFIIVGLGIGAGVAWLGWAAAAIAVLVAYLRAFGTSLGQEADYSGPMAKQHRMAAVTVAAITAAVFSAWLSPAIPLQIALCVIVLGGGVTALRRSLRIRTLLSQSP